jgi:hypothetical protein
MHMRGGGEGRSKEWIGGCKAFSQKYGTLVIRVNKTIDKKHLKNSPPPDPPPPCRELSATKNFFFGVPRLASFIFHLIFNCNS